MLAETKQVRDFLIDLQARICSALEAEDGSASFVSDPIHSDAGGLSNPHVLAEGACIERAGVNFTHSVGDSLPQAATLRRPELSGRSFQAVSLSMIIHPRNPMAPTSHANFRFFVAMAPNQEAIWWFGGGYDLTPIYGFDEDAIHFHRTAKTACEPFGAELYAKFKTNCDEYFYLPHRGEARGVGGIFFDDFKMSSWDESLSFMKAVGNSFIDAYLPILQRRKDMNYGENERRFQLMRRGRYVEFNLLYDRGTKYGIQSGRRVEAVMCSMPPQVSWSYGYEPKPKSPEARLYSRYLRPQDWANMSSTG
jgi:coproporphyrinogen III oxidase